VRLSTKSRYGLRALFDIAYNAGNQPAQIKDISRRQEISPRYLEQIFQNFKKAGILKSKKGPQGGYFLTRKPDQISIRQIVEAAEGDTLLVACACEAPRDKTGCTMNGQCVTQTVWTEATAHLNGFFEHMSLQDLCERGQDMGVKRESDHRFMYYT
jgi:Rrf2 family protein